MLKRKTDVLFKNKEDFYHFKQNTKIDQFNNQVNLIPHNKQQLWIKAKN